MLETTKRIPELPNFLQQAAKHMRIEASGLLLPKPSARLLTREDDPEFWFAMQAGRVSGEAI